MAGISETNTEKETTPIKFARFVDGELTLFTSRPEDTEYVAFSHVWGEWQWRTIPGIPYEVKASQEKADFIANDLPALVGDGAFWMDTLTVNQRDDEDIMTVVRMIPAIFRLAQRTIAVRESDGLYDCCIEAIRGFESYDELCKKLLKHSRHDVATFHVFKESYLQRLWTLQECLLSRKIQFVVPKNNKPKNRARDKYDASFSSYRSQVYQQIILDSLWVLAFNVKGWEGVSGETEFLKAYCYGGTILNSSEIIRSYEEDIHSMHKGIFMHTQIASHRSATLPEDYFVATMTQFPWYQLPRDTKKMTFGQLYQDLYHQAARKGHWFTSRFTRSMLDKSVTDPIQAWLPSVQQPTPSCLGDFLKMIGNLSTEATSGVSPHVHVTTVVKVVEFCCGSGIGSVLDVIESTMKQFYEPWTISHRAGELSKFGNYPSHAWELREDDALRSGWFNPDPEHGCHIIEEGEEMFIRAGPGLDHVEDELFPERCSLDEVETFQMQNDREYITLFEQSRIILDHMLCAMDPNIVDRAQQGEWQHFKKQMRHQWSIPLRHTMLLFAAMIIARIPLSAAAWVNRQFVPVYCLFGDSLLVPGLLARHARKDIDDRLKPRLMLSVGQHLPPSGDSTAWTPFGRDIVLVDPATKAPVGILPNFLPHDESGENYDEMTRALYHGFIGHAPSGQVAYTIYRLRTVGGLRVPSGDSS